MPGRWRWAFGYYREKEPVGGVLISSQRRATGPRATDLHWPLIYTIGRCITLVVDSHIDLSIRPGSVPGDLCYWWHIPYQNTWITMAFQICANLRGSNMKVPLQAYACRAEDLPGLPGSWAHYISVTATVLLQNYSYSLPLLTFSVISLESKRLKHNVVGNKTQRHGTRLSLVDSVVKLITNILCKS